MKTLKIAVIAQLVFFASWAAWLAYNDSRPEADFWIETMPVDPRDLLSGNYVELVYRIEAPEVESCKNYDSWKYRGKTIYADLVPDREEALSDGRNVMIYSVRSCHEQSDSAKMDEKTVVLNAKWRQKRQFGVRTYLEYANINRYYMNENDRKLNIRSGKAAVHVQKNRNGNLRLLEIEEIA